MDQSSDRMERRVKEIFRQAGQTPLGPSPFLKTRVLAHVRENRARAAGLRWKVWALASTAASALLLAVVLWPMKPSLTAGVDQKVLVRVEVKALEDGDTAYARIELPDGMFFVSAKYPELREAREVRLAWMPEFQRSGLLVVVQALKPGNRTIRVFLLDRNDAILTTKEVTITFRESV